MEKIPEDYSERLDKIIDLSWSIFKSQFTNGRVLVTREAPFQHHLASIIKTVGNLFCIKREEVFFTDLERKCPEIKNKDKYFDMVCGFIINGEEIKASIELKFKTKQQGAQDYGRIDAYKDIEALEESLNQGHSLGRFFMVTDSTSYINPSSRGVGTIFPMHNGHVSKPGKFQAEQCKGREDVVVEIKGQYKFEWEKINNFYFLELNIKQN